MRLHSLALVAGLASLLTGCAGLGMPKSDAKPELSQESVGSNVEAGTAKVDVIFQPEKGKAERLERSLTEATTVQQLLTQTGALKKYGRIEVEILRQRPAGGEPFTIPCEYDRSTRQIDPVNDYALMPGDRIIVKEDTSTVIDDILQSAGGNLGKRFTTGGKHKPTDRFRRVEG